tara:strand:+ start:2596 stop:3093 length:498 start_codon:yes stop_codon:yes gene_type:complete
MDYTTNYYIKLLTDKMAKSMCFLDPNFVSIMNMIFTLYIGYVYYANKGIILFIGLVILRTFIDIFDNSLSTMCNKNGNLYESIDYIGNSFFFIILLTVLYLKKEHPALRILSILFINILLACILISSIYRKNKTFIHNNIIFSMITDNTIILIPLIGYLFYAIVY